MENLLKNACDELKIEIKKEQIDQFLKYKDILLEWNDKINLTAITDEREIILKHFVDCLLVTKFRDFDKKSFIDVGTGAGFPAVPIKIMAKNSKATLLDSLNKRIKFLQTLSENINLLDIDFFHLRAEQGGQDKKLREKFDFCTSRAVASLNVLAEYTLPFVKVGGELIALKGPDVLDELKSAENAIRILGGDLTEVQKVQIPFTDITHYLVFIKKIIQTPSKYPRKEGKVTKNPIN